MLLRVELAACVGRLKRMGLLHVAKQGFPFGMVYSRGRWTSVWRNTAFPKPLQLFKLFGFTSDICFEALT